MEPEEGESRSGAAAERLRALLLPRVIEEKMLRLIRQGRLSKWFSGYGQEAVAVGCALALRPSDYILPLHRNLGVWTTRGVPLKPLFCQLMGRDGGFTKGRDRTFHFGLPARRIIGMISHLGAMLPVGAGLALAARLRRSDAVALAFCGDGATREGDFHEALSLAGVWKLPLIVVVESNGYGLSTPSAEALPVENLSEAAAGYGIRGETVDGNDLEAVIGAVAQAAARARRGEGAGLVEMRTFRMRGHEEASGVKYVPPALLEAWAARDPVEAYVRALLGRGAADEAGVQALREALEAEVEAAAEWALGQPEAESTLEAELADVYAPAAPAAAPPPPEGPERRFLDAVTLALDQALAADPDVLLLGQDIAGYGGVFKATEGLAARYGPERVRNTPIIESGVVGAAVGLALEGFKPVVEMQYADFITCAFNQIVNNAATTRYRWGAALNLTIRAPYGGGVGAGPFHSQSMEAWFAHTPGLKVVVPSTPYEAKGLLAAAIADPNPVLFFEHKALYRALKGPLPEAPYMLPLGQARMARAGRDLTIVTYGMGVHWALAEAEYQQSRGCSIEVLDLRTLAPLDEAAILASVGRTSRLLALHEAPAVCGFGAEVLARVAERAFHLLDAPPARVAGAAMPIPFGRLLERDVYSASARLREAVERTLAY